MSSVPGVGMSVVVLSAERVRLRSMGYQTTTRRRVSTLGRSASQVRSTSRGRIRAAGNTDALVRGGITENDRSHDTTS